MKYIIIALLIAITTACASPTMSMLSSLDMSGNDRERVRFIWTAKYRLGECDPINKHLTALDKRLQELEPSDNYKFWAMDMDMKLFVGSCETWQNNVENWANTGEYRYIGQGQFFVVKDER
jgi:hypothetical protein